MISPAFQDQVLSKGKRAQATLPIINKTKWSNLQIPLPPLPTQRALVARLDAAFGQIERARLNLERNVVNARELFQAKLAEVFGRRGAGALLGDLCDITMGQSPSSKTYNKSGSGTPLINGPIEFGPTPFSKTEKTKWTTDPKKLCKEGDLILCVRGSTTGRMNIAGFDAAIGRGVASIRYLNNQDWINYFIRANRQTIYDLGTGSTFPNVSSKILADIEVPVVSDEEQQRQVDTLKKFDHLIHDSIDNYFLEIENLTDLKQSLLQKAFSGQL
jgi:type I restriction enzyme S subunit